MRREGIFLFLLLCWGCASQPVALLNGSTREGAPICLENPAGIPAIVQKFFATRDLTTEEGKIDYLLERVRNSNLTFVRNRIDHDGPSSAAFLRWKQNRLEKRYGIKVETAQDFISKIVAGSRVSGHPYAVILDDGSSHNLQSVLQNELNALESCLKQFSDENEKKPSQAVSPPAEIAR